MDPLPFRGRVPDSLKTADSAFLGTQPNVKEDLRKRSAEFMVADLAKSGLVPDDIGATDLPYLYPHIVTAYLIPYHSPAGAPVTTASGDVAMWRRRQLLALGAPDGMGKYTQPSRAEVGDLAVMPYFPPAYSKIPAGGPLWICEGEKKAACVSKHLGIRAIGIGGCDNWRAERNTDVLNPYIASAIAEASEVRLIPDGDWIRYHIRRAYGGLARAIQRVGKQVFFCALPPLLKIDDAIVQGMREFDWAGSEAIVESLPALARQFGLSTSGERLVPDQNESNVSIILRDHPTFAGSIWYNADKDQLCIGDTPMGGDTMTAQLLVTLQHTFGFTKVTPRKVMTAFQAVAKDNERQPFLDAIRDTPWDGKARLATWLLDYCGVADSPYTQEVGTKFLVGAVGRMVNPGSKMDWMLIAKGAQGIGKSSMPVCLWGQPNVTNLVGTHTDNDTRMLMHSGLVINFEELDTFRTRDVTHLKATISNSVDSYRPPYAALTESHKRRCVLYGSTNKEQFLPQDDTGYRRFVVVEFIDKVKFKALETDAKQLWAEAFVLHDHGEVDYSEVTLASNNAAQYVVDDIIAEDIGMRLQELITKNLMPVAKHNGVDVFYIMGSELAKTCGLSERGATGQRVASVLREAGFYRIEKLAGKRKVWAKPK